MMARTPIISIKLNPFELFLMYLFMGLISSFSITETTRISDT